MSFVLIGRFIMAIVAILIGSPKVVVRIGAIKVVVALATDGAPQDTRR